MSSGPKGAHLNDHLGQGITSTVAGSKRGIDTTLVASDIDSASPVPVQGTKLQGDTFDGSQPSLLVAGQSGTGGSIRPLRLNAVDLLRVEIANSVGVSFGTTTAPIVVNQLGPNSTGVHGVITVNTSAVQANVSGSNIANRDTLTVFNNHASITIFWGYSNTVTTSTGTPIKPGAAAAWDIGSTLTVWLIAGSSNNDVRVTEAS